MLSSVLATTGWAARKTFVVGSLAFIGFVVGVGCVLLPAGVPFGIVGLAGVVLLWTMPDLRSVPSRLVLRLIGPVIFTSLSVPYYIAIAIPGAPLISIRRAFLYSFVAALIVTLSASSKYRLILMERLKTLPLLFYLNAGYLLLVLVTIPISIAPSVSLGGIVQATVTWYLPLLGVVLFIEKSTQILLIFRILMLCLLVNFVVGAVEVAVERPMLWQLLPAIARANLIETNPMLAGMETGNFRNGIYRAVSTYTVGLSWAEMVAMVSPVAAYFIAHGTSGLTRFLGILGLGICVASLIFSGSRGGYVCTIAALSAYLVLWAIRKFRMQPENLFGAIAMVLCSIAVVTVLGAIAWVPKFHIMVFGNGATQASNLGRTLEWAAARPVIYASPIWGHGFAAAGQIFSVSPWGGPGTIDDYRINLLVDNGILGFLLFFGVLVVAIWITAQIYITNRSAAGPMGATISCGLIAYSIDRVTFSQTDNNILMYIFVALVFALHRIVQTPSTMRKRDV